LPASDFFQYLSLAGLGGQIRVRVTLKGRDTWSGSAGPYIYLDGQVFGEPGTRTDGVTLCTTLALPSGSDARASDFESWFWLTLLVFGQTDYSVGDLPLCITTADFNKDGHMDIAVATLAGGVFILLNDGSGNFNITSRYQAGGWPLSIAAAQFTKSNNTDLAMTSYTDGTVTVLLGNGDGTFSPAPSSPVSVGNTPWGLIAADLNGTGTVDLAVTNAQADTVSILVNNGNVSTDGNAFGSPATVKVGNTPTSLVAAKFRSANLVDLAVLNAVGNNVTLLLNSGKATFTASSTPLALPTGSTSTTALPLSLIAADFNRDGLPDLAVGGIYQLSDATTDAYVEVFLNSQQQPGNLSFSQLCQVSGLPGSLTAQDFNGDGFIDIVATGASFLGGTSSYSVLIGNGDGTFQSQVVYPVGSNVNPISIVSADFDGDGIPDLAMGTEGGNVSVFLNEQAQITSTGNRVQITGFVATQPIHVGDQIEIDGAGFLVPAELNQVSIGGSQVTDLSSSLNSSTKLFVNVPNIPGATSAGILVNITVSNTSGSATSSFQLQVFSAVTAPRGNTDLQFSTPPVMPVGQPDITSGQAYTFSFSLVAVTTLAANYALTASATGTGWSAQLVGSSTIAVAAGQSTNVSLQVTAGTGVGIVTLSAVETTPGSVVSPGNAELTITAGSPPPTPETSIRVTLAGASGGGTVSGAGVVFTLNTEGVIGFTIVLTNAGNNYTVTAALGTPAGWTIGAIAGSPFNIQPAPPVGSPATTTIGVPLTAATGAAATNLLVTVHAPDGTSVTYGMPVSVG